MQFHTFKILIFKCKIIVKRQITETEIISKIEITVLIFIFWQIKLNVT